MNEECLRSIVYTVVFKVNSNHKRTCSPWCERIVTRARLRGRAWQSHRVLPGLVHHREGWPGDHQRSRTSWQTTSWRGGGAWRWWWSCNNNDKSSKLLCGVILPVSMVCSVTLNTEDEVNNIKDMMIVCREVFENVSSTLHDDVCWKLMNLTSWICSRLKLTSSYWIITPLKARMTTLTCFSFSLYAKADRNINILNIFLKWSSVQCNLFKKGHTCILSNCSYF